MSLVEQDVVAEVSEGVARRWQGIDPLLPAVGELSEGCGETFVATGAGGRPDGIGVCTHRYNPPDSQARTWGSATEFILAPRVGEPDALRGLDQLLTQWRTHLAGLPEAQAGDTSALVRWPSRDVSGVRALLAHGMQPMTVIAARLPGRPVSGAAATQTAGVVIREAGPGDVDAVAELEMGVITWDEQFGVSTVRPATEALLRADYTASLARQPSWTWLAERDGQAVGLLVVQPPESAGWIAPLTGASPIAYLATMFVRPQLRSAGIGAALVQRAHHALDSHGVALTLLHYAQVNPVSGPLWNRAGYRPLWTIWEIRPPAALR